MLSILRCFVLQILFVVSLGYGSFTQALTLDQVYDHEEIICGVTTGEPGFSAPNTKNEWIGIEVDLCRAIAITVFGDIEAVEITPLISSERLPAVSSGDVHVLAAKTHSTWTTKANYNLAMIGPYFRDGQGFLVRKSKNISSAWALQNVTTCAVSGGIEEEQLRRFLKQLKSYISISLFENIDATISSFDEGDCDVISTDITALNGIKRKLDNPNSAHILPQLISQKPIGLLVSAEHSQWVQLVELVFAMLVQAEELNVTSFNIEKVQEFGSPIQKQFIEFSKNDKFDIFSNENWLIEVIIALGNYGEMFQRHLGVQSLAEFPRGINKSWQRGGLTTQDPLY